jgi:hypothetical protein
LHGSRVFNNLARAKYGPIYLCRWHWRAHQPQVCLAQAQPGEVRCGQ